MGVFDSGVGGLTVLHECLVTMPHEDFVYLGDHARLPYGPRTRDEVRRFAHEIGSYLERQGVTHVLLASPSSGSARELRALIAAYPGWLVPMHGWPGARWLYAVAHER